MSLFQFEKQYVDESVAVFTYLSFYSCLVILHVSFAEGLDDGTECKHRRSQLVACWRQQPVHLRVGLLCRGVCQLEKWVVWNVVEFSKGT